MGRKAFTIFTVEGHGHFPLDMLRYDACYPQTGEDVEKMSYNSEEGVRQRRRVHLVHRTIPDERNGAFPTRDRWMSFGWRVVDEISR